MIAPIANGSPSCMPPPSAGTTNPSRSCRPADRAKARCRRLMLHEGFELDADDYVAVDALTLHAMPFPAALSVKSGALPVLSPLFPSLASSRQYHFKNTRKTISYIPVNIPEDFYEPRTLRSVVFTRYSPGAGFRFARLSGARGPAAIHGRCLGHRPASIRRQIHRLVRGTGFLRAGILR